MEPDDAVIRTEGSTPPAHRNTPHCDKDGFTPRSPSKLCLADLATGC